MENWLKMPECQHITGTECEFSLRDANIFTYMKFRVRAEKGNRTSSWNEVEQFIPFESGEKALLAAWFPSVTREVLGLVPLLPARVSGSLGVVTRSLLGVPKVSAP